ncbi:MULTISPECIES: hypothetical protein [Cyanophyceae]|uniref:hypothetical protein n=1 Tax=Cyanophyceae TaxID=3028117 RepID=UPI00232E6A78|nr:MULTISPECIES: hypothetical protein [Cyanophyceae]MDB9316673.1 hypothetical protein [Nodularia spumigena CS-590/01A]MDB9328327.1 hypothetical protein [Nodularia spumigena CS-590/02]MDB9334082.1 hypothetical protein [Nodularia spumigena CS-590/01]MDB9339505.1 hypothetical protein [Nodularia spumigena CS-589/07]MDB9342973.1 hypothetical protein [Nodularia spumigena CS-588/06]
MSKYSRLLVSLIALIIGWSLNFSHPNSIAIASPLSQVSQVFTTTPVTLASLDSSLWETLLKRSYITAVEDAKTADESEISTTLQAISNNNPNLKWRDYQGQKQVLMVTWTSWNGYDNQVDLPVELSREAWVTAVPELKTFAQTLNLNPESLTLRLEQYLGLPPHNGKTKFVEMWVNASDLFRPCPDAEVNDTSCDFNFPDTVEPQHQTWINNLQLVSYGDKGYPWTRLGYSYDWGSLDGEIGASEFVVRKGAKVIISSVKNTVDYSKL